MIGKDLVQGVAGYGPSVHEALKDLADELVRWEVWVVSFNRARLAGN